MRINLLLLISFLGSAFPAWVNAQVEFVPNQGQWQGDFNYKVAVGPNALFLTDQGYTAVMQPQQHFHAEKETENDHDEFAVAYSMTILGAERSSYQASEKSDIYHNYFYGKQPEKWVSNVPVYSSISQSFNNGIRLNWGGNGQNFKYDILLDSPDQVSELKQHYKGVSSIQLEEDQLVINLPNGSIKEYIPRAYQLIDGIQYDITCSYSLKGDTVGFKLDGLHGNHPVVIDPVLVFSTYTGSGSANWGYTATYSQTGAFYAGGIVQGVNFPSDSLGIQPNFGGGVSDVTINKFSADGSQMIFSTFLGGSGVEQPHSMMEDQNGDLFLMGNTGSLFFPTTAGAYQENFVVGSDTADYVFKYGWSAHIFIVKISGDGKNLLSSTLIGGKKSEGLNLGVFDNYGDNNRGEIQVLDNGDLAFISQASSTDLSFDATDANLSSKTQHVLLGVFNSSLTALSWGKYFGGSDQDAGYALRAHSNHLFITGSTKSTDLPGANNTLQTSNAGDVDGYVAKFDLNTGQLLATTYLGTDQLDQSFLIDVDKFGYPYIFGQSRGSMPISANVYSNSNSQQFLQKLQPDLTAAIWQTQVGSSKNKRDLVPTALMVDQCQSIYLSGWNGSSNDIDNRGQLGNTFDLPTSADALQKTTDGADFYFMVLSRDAGSLLYGSYFGASAQEHCDGGTSRFSPDGTIYQAACAACQSQDFPTTPGSYSPTKPNGSCNYAAIKIDFENVVEARPEIDITTNVDTVCNTLEVTFDNSSIKANKYFWDFGNGQTSTSFEPTAQYAQFGTYTITLIAEDTICGIADTATVEIEHDRGVRPQAQFESLYKGCDGEQNILLKNTSSEPTTAEWFLSDGSSLSGNIVNHQLPGFGTYEITLIVTSIECGTKDTAFGSVTFTDSVPEPNVNAFTPACSRGVLDFKATELRSRYLYQWSVGTDTFTNAEPNIQFEEPGRYEVKLVITDTVCRKTYDRKFDIIIDEIIQDVYIPNAFTPNADGINDQLIMTGNSCQTPTNLQIFNRWGTLVYETDRPFEKFWDGRINGNEAAQGVFVYLLKTGSDLHKGHITLIR